MTDDVAEIDEVYDPYGKEEDEAVTGVDVFAYAVHCSFPHNLQAK